MFEYSDSDSKDSDEGIRFKTDSIRTKCKDNSEKSRSRSISPKNDRKRHKKHNRHKKHRRRSSSASSSSERDQPKIEREEIGPILPPHLSKNRELEMEPISDESVDFKAEESKKTEVQENDIKEAEIMGPALPPHLQKLKKETDVAQIGPVLPPHLMQKSAEKIEPELESKEEKTPTIGPMIPAHLREKLADSAPVTEDILSEEDECYGPVPDEDNKLTKSRLALEERALKLKMDELEPKQDKKGREEWMTELPPAKAGNLGLGPRQFRSKAGPDMSDRSSWTDTPEDKKARREGRKEEKIDLKMEAELREIKKRDKEQEKISKKHKKEKDSLLEIHQKKMKKEKKDESGPSERRPFSRETDLQVNRFDEAQKKAVLKKAQLLDDRFSSGQSKFL